MNRIKELRDIEGLTQTDLAKKTGLTQRNISYWESGNIELNINSAIILAQFFGVSVEYLVGLEDDFGTTTAPINGAPSYSSEERELVKNYRELNQSGKQLIKETIKTLRATSAQSEQKKKA